MLIVSFILKIKVKECVWPYDILCYARVMGQIVWCFFNLLVELITKLVVGFLLFSIPTNPLRYTL